MSTATKTRPATIEVRELPELEANQHRSRPAATGTVAPSATPKKGSFWSRLGDARYHVRSL